MRKEKDGYFILAVHNGIARVIQLYFYEMYEEITFVLVSINIYVIRMW